MPSPISLAVLGLSAAAALSATPALAATHASAPAEASSPALSGEHPVLDRIRQRGYVVLAHRESSVPFSYVEEGKAVGYALDLCHKIVEAIGKELKIKDLAVKMQPVTPANRIAAIVDGTADLECGSTTNNAERREKVAFTVPHYITGSRIAVRSDSPIGALEQFEGHTVVSTKGTTPLKAVESANKERLLRINVVAADDHASALKMVADGKADGFVMDDVLLYGLIASSADPARFKVVGKFLTVEPLAIMMSKSDPELKRIADNEMKHLIRDGEAQALYDRWFMKPIPPKNASLNLPMSYLLKDFWKYPSDMVPF